MKILIAVFSLFFLSLYAEAKELQSLSVQEQSEGSLIVLRADQALAYTLKQEGAKATLSFIGAGSKLKERIVIDNGSLYAIESIVSLGGVELVFNLEAEATLSISSKGNELFIKIPKQKSETPPPELRVELLSHQDKIKISADGDFELFDEGRSTLAKGKAKDEWSFSSKKGKILTKNKKESYKSSEVFIVMKDKDARLSAKKRQYRGTFKVIYNSDHTLSLLNIVDIESYLYGVVPREMPASWPKEALAAQAIAARTYALQRQGYYEDEGFDLKDSTADQVYGGASAEHPKATAAVDLTRGLTAVDAAGARIKALYFSTSGGSTEDNDLVFPQEPLPYLRATKSVWVKDSPHDSWTLSFTKEELEAKLNAKPETKVGALRALSLESKGASGRWAWVLLEGESEQKRVSGHQFRKALGAGKLKSTLFTMSVSQEVYTFDGKGYGHGVGMPQYAAKAMAADGQQHRQILRAFYGEDIRFFLEYQ